MSAALPPPVSRRTRAPRRAASAVTGGRPGAIVRVAKRLRADAARVYAAWIDPAVARRWLFATATCPMAEAAIEARVGGGFRLAERREGTQVDHVGEFVLLEPPYRLAFLLAPGNDSDGATLVDVSIEPRRGGCRLALTHAGVAVDRAGAVRTRWIGILYGLGATLDALCASGTAFRHARRGDTQPGERSCITC